MRMRNRRRLFQRNAPGRNRFLQPQGDKPGSGPGGMCVCPKCGYRRTHYRAVPCNSLVCPKCGTTLTKE